MTLFFKKFPNLKSILLNRVTLNNNIMLMLSKFPLLESLFLYDCCFWSHIPLSTIFDYCTTLKEFHMTNDSHMFIDLTIPRQLEILGLKSKGKFKLDLTHSIELQSLSVKSESEVTIIVKDLLAYLEKVKFVGNLTLKILGNWKNLVTNVKKLCINAFGCYSVFGTLSDSTTIPCSNEVPKFTFGTYRLNFSMIPYLGKVRIENYSDRDRVFLALPKGNRVFVNLFCVQKGKRKHMESKHNPSRGPRVAKLVW